MLSKILSCKSVVYVLHFFVSESVHFFNGKFDSCCIASGHAKVDNYIFTLGTCLPIENANVIECINESAVLLKWKELVLEVKLREIVCEKQKHKIDDLREI